MSSPAAGPHIPSSILWSIPAATPPPGVKSNFTNPPTLARSIVIVNAVFLSLMLVVVFVRFYSKKFIAKQKYDLSDLTLFIATLGSIAHSGLTIYNTTVNYGRHQWDIQALSLTRRRTQEYSSVDVIYIITTYFVKISLLILFYSFFAMLSSRVRKAIIFGAAFLSIYTIPYLTVSILRVVKCEGIQALAISYCHNQSVVTTNAVFGAINIATDFYILAIPASQLRGLHLPTKRKIGLMLIFLAGFVACSMSIVRLAIIISRYHSNDTLYTAATVSHFSAIEMKLAIICCCAVYFPGFFRESKTSVMKVYESVSRSSKSSVDSTAP